MALSLAEPADSVELQSPGDSASGTSVIQNCLSVNQTKATSTATIGRVPRTSRSREDLRHDRSAVTIRLSMWTTDPTLYRESLARGPPRRSI